MTNDESVFDEFCLCSRIQEVWILRSGGTNGTARYIVYSIDNSDPGVDSIEEHGKYNSFEEAYANASFICKLNGWKNACQTA